MTTKPIVTLRQMIARQSVMYALSFGIGQVITMALAVYIRNALGPVQMGIWVILQVVLRYNQFISLGLPKAVLREVPYQKGHGDFVLAEQVRNSAFTFICSSSIFFSALVLAAAFILRIFYGDLVFYSTLALAFMCLFERASRFCLAMARAEKKFNFIYRFNIYSALVNAVLTVLLVHQFALYGFFLSMILTYAFNFLYPYWCSRIRYTLYWDAKLIASLSKMGIGLVFVHLSANFLQGVDKLSIGTFIGLKEAGLYSIVVLAANLMLTLPQMLNAIVFPYQNEAYGLSKDAKQIQKFVAWPNLLMAWYLPVLIAIGAAFSPYAVHRLMPDYIEGVGALKIGLFGALFLILANQMMLALITFKKHVWAIPINGLIGAALLGVNYVWVQFGAGILQIAFTTLVAYIFLYVGFSVIVLGEMYSETRDVLAHLAMAFSPALYFGAVVAVSDVWLPGRDLETALARTVVLAVTALPVLLYGEKRFRLLQTVKGALFEHKRQKPKVAVELPGEA